MVEVMVAAVILSAGVLGVFVMVETADGVNERNRERNTATSLSREILEKARPTAYRTIGTTNWFNAPLTALEGRNGSVTNPATNRVRVDVKRRGVVYSVEVENCTVDDARDGYGVHSSTSTWCPDSSSASTADVQPEDLKRVAVKMTWTGRNGTPQNLYQTATFGSGGQVVGPNVTDLAITAPTGVDQANPVITSNPTSPAGIVRFLGTAAGAADMKFAVEGVEQSNGVSGGNGSWTFDWNIVPLKDGLYTISATAVDALGVRGAPRVMQVRLARATATPPQNVTGGYNYVFAAGVKRTVVELMWDASPEGNVTGYEVTKPGGTVCAATLETSCMDLAPAASGSTVYTVKTLYTDGLGNPASVSTDYTVAAPGTAPATGATFWFHNTATNSQTKCTTPFGGARQQGPGSRKDVKTTDPAGSELTWTNAANGNGIWGCMTPFTAPTQMTGGTNNVTISAWFRNTLTGTTVCKIGLQVFRNAAITPIIAAGMNGGGAQDFTIPANTPNPTLFTQTYGAPNITFPAGDQLTVAFMGFSAAGTNGNDCRGTTMYWNSTARPAKAVLPLPNTGGGGGTNLARPAAPSGLTSTDNGDGTVTLSWTRPSGTPAPEFYRIYRDGQNYTERVETAGDTGAATVTWVDTDRGGTTHTYSVTAASSVLAESDFAGPVTR